jgi:hypothetical protein
MWSKDRAALNEAVGEREPPMSSRTATIEKRLATVERRLAAVDHALRILASAAKRKN